MSPAVSRSFRHHGVRLASSPWRAIRAATGAPGSSRCGRRARRSGRRAGCGVAAFATPVPRALCRTRTGDPFLTMAVGPRGERPRRAPELLHRYTNGHLADARAQRTIRYPPVTHWVPRRPDRRQAPAPEVAAAHGSASRSRFSRRAAAANAGASAPECSKSSGAVTRRTQSVRGSGGGSATATAGIGECARSTHSSHWSSSWPSSSSSFPSFGTTV
jgi:hypothetical protein